MYTPIPPYLHFLMAVHYFVEKNHFLVQQLQRLNQMSKTPIHQTGIREIDTFTATFLGDFDSPAEVKNIWEIRQRLADAMFVSQQSSARFFRSYADSDLMYRGLQIILGKRSITYRDALDLLEAFPSDSMLVLMLCSVISDEDGSDLPDESIISTWLMILHPAIFPEAKWKAAALEAVNESGVVIECRVGCQGSYKPTFIPFDSSVVAFGLTNIYRLDDGAVKKTSGVSHLSINLIYPFPGDPRYRGDQDLFQDYVYKKLGQAGPFDPCQILDYAKTLEDLIPARSTSFVLKPMKDLSRYVYVFVADEFCALHPDDIGVLLVTDATTSKVLKVVPAIKVSEVFAMAQSNDELIKGIHKERVFVYESDRKNEESNENQNL